MINFELPADLVELRGRVCEFIETAVVPLESDPRWGNDGVDASLHRELIGLAAAKGLLSPHAPVEFGGLSLDHRGMAVIFEAAGWSPLGALALNIQAPDEGNVNLLNRVATDAQKQYWLPRIVSGEARTVFSMTETHTGGAGADPSLLQTEARECDGGYRISGRKYMITGYIGAALNIVMARTFDREGKDLGATMFLTEVGAPGVKMDRKLSTIDTIVVGGHVELTFDDLFVPHANVLGEIGQGFRNAQVRLGPARLTHCMRWLGLAARCHAIALEHSRTRQSFAKPLHDHQGVGYMLADNEMDLHMCRLAIWQAAWLLDQHDHARNETSIAKVFCSEALSRVVDRSMQILGSVGISDDTIVGRVYRDIRAFRIYDGPSEVHRHALAQRIAKVGPFDPYRAIS